MLLSDNITEVTVQAFDPLNEAYHKGLIEMFAKKFEETNVNEFAELADGLFQINSQISPEERLNGHYYVYVETTCYIVHYSKDEVNIGFVDNHVLKNLEAGSIVGKLDA